jgi:hypothetical protein
MIGQRLARWVAKLFPGSTYRATAFRPQVEALEGRECPAIFNIAAGDVAGLINALNIAQTNNQPDTINLAANSVYSLSAVDNLTNGPNGLPVINNDGVVTLNGNGATIARANASPAFRILNIVDGQLIMRDVVISGGNAQGAFGGGIRLSDSVPGGPDNLVLRNSLIQNNAADNDGGGVFVSSGGQATIVNTTITGNTAGNFGGGVSVLAGAGTVNIVNATLARNVAAASASPFPGSSGGGLAVEGGIVNVSNCILFDNHLTSLAGPVSDVARIASAGGTINSRNSLYGETPSVGPGNTINGLDQSNKFSQDPALGTLKNNGGTTSTIAITSPTSPAIDAGDNAQVPASDITDDQRGPGFHRVINGAVDMGAYEFQQPAVIVGLDSSLNPSPVGQAVTFTAGVAGVAANSNAPQGTFTFIIDGVPVATVPVVNGLATFTTSTLTAGNHGVQAVFNPIAIGDYSFASGSSGVLTQMVTATPPPNPAPTPTPTPLPEPSFARLTPIGRRWRR